MKKGISLIEILVVVTIFAILGIIIARSVILSLQGSQKSESLVAVRENLDYSMSVIERQIRNASSVDCDASNSISTITTPVLIYTDENGDDTQLSCENIGQTDSYVASGSGKLRLTSPKISITACTLKCNSDPTSSQQKSVDVSLTAMSSTLSGPQNSTVTTNTRIYLRNY